MTRAVLYVAAPLRPTEEEIASVPISVSREAAVGHGIRANLDRAMRWLAWLRKSFPETTFIAPWIASVLAGADDTDHAQREAGMADACAVVERCDGIVLCGGRISEGMRRKMEHGRMRRKIWIDPADQSDEFKVYDMTRCGSDPPDGTRERWIGGQACPMPWSKWSEQFLR